MKVLFICHANASRSQMAEAIYNSLTKSNNAKSAGTKIDFPGETLLVRSKRIGGTYTLGVMSDAGIDISENTRTQLTRDMPSKYDAVINMAAKRYTPAWLPREPNYHYWPISDPGMISYHNTELKRDSIRNRIITLINSGS